MTPTTPTPAIGTHSCSCWKCWIQANFSVIILFTILVFSFAATVILMHEEVIADKYVIWLQGWDAGILTSLGVALKSDHVATRHQIPDTEYTPQPQQKKEDTI